MKYDSKIGVCKYVNEIFKTKRSNFAVDYAVNVPIYKSKFKLLVLNLLSLFVDVQKIESPMGSRKISFFDFSRLIRPDKWMKYEMSKGYKLALPKFTIEHQYSWEIQLVYEFYKEDLRYGVKPIDIYQHIGEYGGGPILVDKADSTIYYIHSRIWVNYDYVKDFELYKEGKATELIWNGDSIHENYPIIKLK